MLNFILLQSTTAQGGGWSMWIMLLAMFAILYFLMIRPQQQRQKKAAAFRDSLQKGDRVVTAGGIHGKISSVKDNTVTLEVTDGVRITVDKNSIYQSMEAVNENGASAKNSDK